MIIVERFEGDIAIIEDTNNSKHIEVDRELLPQSVKEGDVLELREGLYIVDENKTAEKRRAIAERLRKLGL
ncbi:MAG: DUF3006 domain-containing protein [Oscillospiraceae bacterium]|nr:DUF3006 domain-containing protein [Oscillospiraceae bacterium]